MVNNSQHPQICAMLSALLFVDYQWCHVLFNNNTVSKDDDDDEEEEEEEEDCGDGDPDTNGHNG